MGAAILRPRPHKILDFLGTRLKTFLLFLDTNEYLVIFHWPPIPDTSKMIMLIFQGLGRPVFQIKYLAGKVLVLKSPPGVKTFSTILEYNVAKMQLPVDVAQRNLAGEIRSPSTSYAVSQSSGFWIPLRRVIVCV